MMSSPLIAQQKQIAINSWYRLLSSGIKISRDCRHFKLHKLLDFAYTQFDQPADYTAKQSLFHFPDCRIRYIQQSKKGWVDHNIDLLMMVSLHTLIAPQKSLVLMLGCLLTTLPKITLLLLMIQIIQFHYRTPPPYFR